jgi:HTH-type transcriptional regulator, sugar sensing transcriptional regulator
VSPKREAPQAQLAEGLRNLGLTEYETRVYLGILRHPGSRIPEVARKSGVPQPKVYATVKRLLERGLCESELGPVNTYTALPPQEALAPLLNELHERVSEADSVVTRLEKEYEKPADSIGARDGRIKVFQGRQANRRNFLELLSGVEETMDIISRMPFVVSDDDEPLEQAIARGVRVRILVEAPDDFDWLSDPMYQRQVEIGTEARSLPAVPMRMVIFDRKISVLPMDDPAGGSKSLLMLEVRNVGLSNSLLSVFETFWEKGAKLPL